MDASIFKLCKELLKISVDYIPTDPLTKLILKAFIVSVEQTSNTNQKLDHINQKVDQISKQTSNINRKVDQLIDAHYKIALRLLKDIDNVSSTRKQDNVEKALDQFRYASEVAVTATAKAQSIFYVGVCYSLLNEPKAALEYYKEANQIGWDYWLESLVSNLTPNRAIILTRVLMDLTLGNIRTPDKVTPGYIRGLLASNVPVLAVQKLLVEPITEVLIPWKSFTGGKKKREEKDELVLFWENFLVPLGELLVRSAR